MIQSNDNLWSIISKLVGKRHKYSNSLFLYRDRHSELVNVIERMLCPKQCYFFPKNCLFRHRYDFKNLMKKELHQSFNPIFQNLFKKDEPKVVKLERARNGQPNMIKLADDIGITTDLEYDENDFIKVDF